MEAINIEDVLAFVFTDSLIILMACWLARVNLANYKRRVLDGTYSAYVHDDPPILAYKYGWVWLVILTQTINGFVCYILPTYVAAIAVAALFGAVAALVIVCTAYDKITADSQLKKFD